LVSYPNTDGTMSDVAGFVKRAHDAKVLVTVDTDLLALTLLKSPGAPGAGWRSSQNVEVARRNLRRRANVSRHGSGQYSRSGLSGLPATVLKSPHARPRIRTKAGSPSRATSATVVIDRSRSFRAVTGPTPHRRSTGSGCRNASSPSIGTTNRPSGFATPLAIVFLLEALDESERSTVRLVSLGTLRRRRGATPRGPGGGQAWQHHHVA